jgi:sulfur relay (sulfurtransferase) complex TusBCD TusD component (DsrE family)
MRFRKQPLCLTESEYTFLHGFFTNSNGMVSQSQNYELAKIYARVFQKKGVEVTSCSSCVKQRVKDLKDIYNTYE